MGVLGPPLQEAIPILMARALCTVGIVWRSTLGASLLVSVGGHPGGSFSTSASVEVISFAMPKAFFTRWVSRRPSWRLPL